MPKVGQIVIYRCANDEIKYNNSQAHPAIVTCRHSDQIINLKVFFDCGPCEMRTSVLWRATAKKQRKEDIATWDYD